VLDSPMAGTVTGRPAIEDFYTRLVSSFPDFMMERTDFMIDGDRVVELSTASGTDKGGFMGHAPSGKRFTFPIVLIYRLNDGRIVHQQAIYDFTGVLMQIGVLKAKPL
jgi:predicted ester cyclase